MPQPASPIGRWTLVLLTLLALAPSGLRAEDSPDVVKDPPYEQFLIVPVRVHILTSDDLPVVNCKLTDADVVRIFGKANNIWHRAGIHLGLESIIREPAVTRDTFVRAKEKNEMVPPPLYRLVRPEGTKAFDGLHVYYVHEFSVNGIWMGEDFAFVKETAALGKVPGGIDEPIPRVTAHELGHAMGLPHRQDRTNLMASGTTGTLLNESEVTRAREKAATIKGFMTVADAWKAAEGKRARQVLSWLSEIPGAQGTAAKRRLEALGPATQPAGTATTRPSTTK